MQSLKITGTKVYCYDPKYNKYMKMGHKIGDIFIKSVEAKHFMLKVNGYGLQADAFDNFRKNGITRIRVHEVHTGNTYMSHVDEWDVNGKRADYGRGRQIFLSLKYMHLQTKAMKEKEAELLERTRREVEQERLFR